MLANIKCITSTMLVFHCVQEVQFNHKVYNFITLIWSRSVFLQLFTAAKQSLCVNKKKKYYFVNDLHFQLQFPYV